MRIAACQYPVAQYPGFDAFAGHLEGIVQSATSAGASLLLLPEYFPMVLATTFAPEVRADLARQLAALQEWHAPFEALLSRLATTYGLHVVGGSFPVRDPDGRYRNRSTIVAADGRRWTQDKRRMTRFERESWGISAGWDAPVIDLGECRLGVAICYDSEFPMLVRDQVARGANLICVPSCTDSLHGYHRVAVACRARALESQCYVLHAHTVGDLPDSPAIDENHGAAGCYVPPDRGFPVDGVIGCTAIDEPGLLVVDVDFARVDAVRADGQVLNYRDW